MHHDNIISGYLNVVKIGKAAFIGNRQKLMSQMLPSKLQED